MNNLPRNAGHGPPIEAADAVLAGLLQVWSDQQSIMPLPKELLQYVGMRSPELAHALYHLKLSDNAPPQGLAGAHVEAFMRNWTPNATATTGAGPNSTTANWNPTATTTETTATTYQSPTATAAATLPNLDTSPSTSPTPDVLLMTPEEPISSDMSAFENGMTFTLSAGPAPSVFCPPPPSESDAFSDAVASPDNSVSGTQYHLSGHASGAGAGAVPRTLMADGEGDDAAPRLSFDWVAIPSSCQGPITAAGDALANGTYRQWNKVCVAFQLVAGHLNQGHVEPAGAGYINVVEYISWNIHRLGLLPQSVYIEHDPAQGERLAGVPVALRDQRNFWSQFYYFTRYAFTEQLLRTKAIRAIVKLHDEARVREAAEQGEPAPSAQAEVPSPNQPYFRPDMGPDLWWVFGHPLDQDWETYFRHMFSNQALPEYLRPWFAQAEVHFVPVSEAKKTEEAAAPADAEDEKENEAPEEVCPNLMSYATVHRMQTGLEAIGNLLYARSDKPSQGESDNLLPKMFFDKLLSLAYQCTSHHPWKSGSVPANPIGLRRLSVGHRDSHMNPLEFYGSVSRRCA